jgi:hypothetical protein
MSKTKADLLQEAQDLGIAEIDEQTPNAELERLIAAEQDHVGTVAHVAPEGSAPLVLAGGRLLAVGESAENVDLKNPTTRWQLDAGLLVVTDNPKEA